MFGHQDSNNVDSAAQPAAPSTDGILSHPASPQTVAPTAGSPAPVTNNNDYILTDLTANQPAAPSPLTSVNPIDAAMSSEPDTDSTPSVVASPSAPPVDSGLLELKQAALHELSPLLDHLEQTAEERFRTMMMMIQASDDQSLLSEAYEAAQNIEDKKARAQALLDVVNEINYFTQQHNEDNPPQQ